MSATADDKAPRLWRSLAELAGSADFRKFVEAEFPSLAAEGWSAFSPGIDRRRLLKLVGAAAAFGGLAACSPAGKIVPYVRQPEEVIPGKPRYFATTLASQGYGIGAIVESHEGRPTKIEGNPDHPASLGGTDAVMQAAVLDLFDPDRSRTPLRNGEPASYDSFLGEVAELRPQLLHRHGDGFAILCEANTSPSVAAQIAALRKAFPEMRLYRHDPLDGGATATATRELFGRPLQPVHDFGKADVIVSLDADFLAEGPGRLAYARGFADRRRSPAPGGRMNRLYAVESTVTITGATADHRSSVRPSAIDAIAAALHAAIGGAAGASGPAGTPPWIEAAAADLQRAGRNGLVIGGDHNSPFTAAAALAMNDKLGAFGTTLRLIEPVETMRPDGDLAGLAKDALAGRVETLLVLGGNPVHTAPADLSIGTAFAGIRRIVHHGLYRDETAAIAHWHIPAAHDLESWSDLCAFDGTASIVQPLIEPLFGGRTVQEVLAAFAAEQDRSALDLVRGYWQSAGLGDEDWRRSLKAGLVAGTAAGEAAVAFPQDLRGLKPRSAAKESLEIRFVADPWLRDGRFANNAWLQELPRPLTKLVWSNAALLSPATAKAQGVENGANIAVRSGAAEIEAAAWICPGHPEGTVTLSFGFGRKVAGPVAALAGGYDAFRLRSAGSSWMATGAAIRKLGGERRLVTTQEHQSMEGRPLARHATWDEFRNDPHFVTEDATPEPDESLYPDWPYREEAWGMAIDENACIGCMACVAACQAENNIATVGPEECARGHEMHWLRVDRYYEGTPDDPDIFFQPIPCMQCEKAPCEIVCPVNATVHTHDGLNAQVYNRCIGTRYCSQNCPYKVRRFNFLTYQEFDEEKAETLVAVHNPNVSVRSRGVMEKCTYCVQRISAARIHAQIENRPIGDGEAVTACQQVCPTRAITFGDLNDKDSHVRKVKQSPLNYTLLAELNTRPRTTYLAKVRNPNAQVKAKARSGGGDGTG